ncbi:hypothetical protein S245_002344 [Arachis hypogaea]
MFSSRCVHIVKETWGVEVGDMQCTIPVTLGLSGQSVEASHLVHKKSSWYKLLASIDFHEKFSIEITDQRTDMNNSLGLD